ncbi:MAG: hypothetical protein KTR30_16530, partial [Saprospiraceae bacterium]|nr:hypothetical protein [Saprospiraceae bacterium]
MDQASQIDETLWPVLIGIIAMLLLAIAIIVFFVLYQKRLFAQKEELQALETAYQRDLLQASIQAQENERKRVAADLHDGIGSLLSAIRLYVIQFSKNRNADISQELINETTEIVDTAIDQTRKIAHNLLPSTLERFGVVNAIESLCKRIESMSELDIKLEYENLSHFSKEQDLAIYRIIQELLSNTLKHAGATEVQIQFQRMPSHQSICYTDNGKNFQLAGNAKDRQ